MIRPIALANSRSGDGSEADIAEWCDQLGLESRDTGDDLESALRAAADDRPPFVAVVGGDGTQRAAATLFADRAGVYEISLVARFTPSKLRRAGRRNARRSIVLARTRTRARATGRVRLRLRLRPAARRALRGRPETLRASLVVRQVSGARAGRRVSTPVRLTVPRRRRAKRRRR